MPCSPPIVFKDEGPPAAEKILDVVVGVARRLVVLATDIPIPIQYEKYMMVLRYPGLALVIHIILCMH